ncbi:MAG: hypothetical protein OEY92_06060, partial [Elusimicrobiota bacterium]|nr:hypothetical protein [Elusimicrobiota bacterium]
YRVYENAGSISFNNIKDNMTRNLGQYLDIAVEFANLPVDEKARTEEQKKEYQKIVDRLADSEVEGKGAELHKVEAVETIPIKEIEPEKKESSDKFSPHTRRQSMPIVREGEPYTEKGRRVIWAKWVSKIAKSPRRFAKRLARVKGVLPTLNRQERIKKLERIIKIILRYYRTYGERAPTEYKIEIKRNLERPVSIKGNTIRLDIDIFKVSPEDLLSFLTFAFGHEGMHPIVGTEEEVVQTDKERFASWTPIRQDSVIRALKALGADKDYIIALGKGVFESLFKLDELLPALHGRDQHRTDESSYRTRFLRGIVRGTGSGKVAAKIVANLQRMKKAQKRMVILPSEAYDIIQKLTNEAFVGEPEKYLRNKIREFKRIMNRANKLQRESALLYKKTRDMLAYSGLDTETVESYLAEMESVDRLVVRTWTTLLQQQDGILREAGNILRDLPTRRRMAQGLIVLLREILNDFSKFEDRIRSISYDAIRQDDFPKYKELMMNLRILGDYIEEIYKRLEGFIPYLDESDQKRALNLITVAKASEAGPVNRYLRALILVKFQTWVFDNARVQTNRIKSRVEQYSLFASQYIPELIRGNLGSIKFDPELSLENILGKLIECAVEMEKKYGIKPIIKEKFSDIEFRIVDEDKYGQFDYRHIEEAKDRFSQLLARWAEVYGEQKDYLEMMKTKDLLFLTLRTLKDVSFELFNGRLLRAVINDNESARQSIEIADGIGEVKSLGETIKEYNRLLLKISKHEIVQRLNRFQQSVFSEEDIDFVNDLQNQLGKINFRLDDYEEGNLIGKLFNKAGEQVKENIFAMEQDGWLVFYTTGRNKLYFKNKLEGTLEEAKVRLGSTITTEDGQKIRLIQDNPYVKGFGGYVKVLEDNVYKDYYKAYIVESLAKNDIAFFHETQEAYYAAHPEKLPKGVNSHTLLRGCGKEVRKAVEELMEKEDISNYTDGDLINYLEANLSPERRNEAEFALIRDNAKQGKKGIELIYGLQDEDEFFGAAKNNEFSEEIRAVSKTDEEAKPLIKKIGLNKIVHYLQALIIQSQQDVPITAQMVKISVPEWIVEKSEREKEIDNDIAVVIRGLLESLKTKGMVFEEVKSKGPYDEFEVELEEVGEPLANGFSEALDRSQSP